ncbi:hypothetical protein [Corallincola holothuriorum]|nr:hypothetical protein [Corallincola holothuriorum]
METLEKLVGLLERLAGIYRELIILILLLVLFGQPLLALWEGVNG